MFTMASGGDRLPLGLLVYCEPPAVVGHLISKGLRWSPASSCSVLFLVALTVRFKFNDHLSVDLGGFACVVDGVRWASCVGLLPHFLPRGLRPGPASSCMRQCPPRFPILAQWESVPPEQEAHRKQNSHVNGMICRSIGMEVLCVRDGDCMTSLDRWGSTDLV